MIKPAYLEAVAYEMRGIVESTKSVTYKNGMLVIQTEDGFASIKLPSLVIEPERLIACWELYYKLIYSVNKVISLEMACYLSSLESILSDAIHNPKLKGGVITYSLEGKVRKLSPSFSYTDLGSLFYLRQGYLIRELPEQGCWIITAPSGVERIVTTFSCDCTEYTARRSCAHALLVQFCCRHRRDLIQLDLLEL